MERVAIQNAFEELKNNENDKCDTLEKRILDLETSVVKKEKMHQDELETLKSQLSMKYNTSMPTEREMKHRNVCNANSGTNGKIGANRAGVK
jgi:hypothetical protein